MSGSTISLVGFGCLLLTALAIEVAARRGLGPTPVQQAVAAAMRTPWGRVTVLGAWLWLGVHFLAR